MSRLLKKKEYPRYHKKKVVAHPEDELSLLYGHANAEERFLLDFFIGSMVRDHEGYGSRYTDVTGVTLTIRGKQHKTRTVEISPRLAGEIKERRKHSDSQYLFINRKRKPNQHLLRAGELLPLPGEFREHTVHPFRKLDLSMGLSSIL